MFDFKLSNFVAKIIHNPDYNGEELRPNRTVKFQEEYASTTPWKGLDRYNNPDFGREELLAGERHFLSFV